MYNVLSTAGGAAGVPGPGPRIDRALLAGKSANEVINAVIEAVRPTDGSQDTEAARASLHDALSELLVRYPDADLLDLTDEQRDFSVEQFVAMDVFRRFDLDLGAHIRDKAPSATTALGRMKEVRDYIRQTISEAFRKLRTDGQKLSTANASRVVTDALRSAMRVFESYAE
jgi:hypothetical protein